MALKISRLQKKEDWRKKEIGLLADLMTNDPHLRKYFKPHHPLFDFEVIDVSDSLTYYIKVKGTKSSIYGSALAFTLSGKDVGVFNHNLFHQGFMSTLRSLVFNVCHESTVPPRSELRLFDRRGNIDWSVVDDFISLSLMRFPSFTLEKNHTDDECRYLISPKYEADLHPVIFKFNKTALFDSYKDHYSDDEFKANKLLKNHLLIQLSRFLLFDVISYSEAEILINGQDMASPGQMSAGAGVDHEAD